MSDIHDWSTTAASNDDAPPDGFPEDQGPETVNNAARELMAAIKRLYQDINGSLTSGGSGNGYTLTTNVGASALSDLPVLTFQVDRDNPSDAPTLDVDGLGTKNMRANGVDLAAGQLRQGTVVVAAYNATDDTFAIFGADQVDGLSMLERSSAPSTSSGKGDLYVKDYDGNTELFWQDESGNEVRLTFKGELVLNLQSTDVVVGSIRTLSFSRGNVVDVTVQAGAGTGGNDLATIDWEQGTVFRVQANADTDLDFINMPDTTVDEEQTIYVDFEMTGSNAVTITSTYTILYPAGGPERGPTADGRDLYLATTDDGTSVMVVPMLDMKENP